jgi:hypothetical protein
MVAVSLLSLVVATVLSACTMWKEPKVSTWKNTTSVEAMERLLWQEVRAGNWLEVEAHLASNFSMTTAGGVLDKQQTIARWKAMPQAEASLGEFAVTDHGDTTVVTYTATAAGGAPERRMSVWQKHKEGWVMIAHAVGQAAASPKM